MTSMQAVVLNCRFLTQPTTGVQRFAANICIELKRILPHAIFVSPPNIIDADTAKILDVRPVGQRTGHLWEQIDLPIFLRQNQCPLLINLANTGPLFYKNQINTLFDLAFVRYPQNFSFGFKLFYNLMAPRLVRNGHALITGSEFSKHEICGHYGVNAEHVHVIACAVDTRFSPKHSSHSGKPYLLAVSSPNFYKNFGRVIQAYSTWAHRNDIDLKIVGNASGNFSRQDYGQLPSGVKFLGRLSDDELIMLYSNALGFIFPSLYEGFGIPPLEAQACGCPVLASNAASIPEVLTNSAVYFNPTNINEMIDAMDILVQDESQRTYLIEKGFDNVKKYSWENSAEKLAIIINHFSQSFNQINQNNENSHCP